MTEYIWRNIRLEVPEDWEMLRFSRKRKVGACMFGDRYQYRLELSWREVPGAPDFDRMLHEYRAKLRERSREDKVLRIERRGAGWHGLIGPGPPQARSRWGCFLESESCLVELVFLWPSDRDMRCEQAVLESLRSASARPGEWRWRALGLDISVPRRLDFLECRADPATACLRFGVRERDEHNESFERLGMLHHWLRSSPAEWLRNKLKDDIEIDEPLCRRVSQHDVARITGTRVRRQALLGRVRPMQVRAAAWICPVDRRLYCATQELYSKRKETEDAGRRLSCCSALPLPPGAEAVLR